MGKVISSGRFYLGDVRLADVALVVYMLFTTAFSSGSLPVQVARVLLVCGAATELKRERYSPGKFELWQALFVIYVTASIQWAFEPGNAKSIASTVLVNAVCIICVAFILRCEPRRIRLLLACMMVAPLLLMMNVVSTDGLMAFADSRGTESFSANTVGMTAAFGACFAGFCCFERWVLPRGIAGSLLLLNLSVVVLSASRKAILMVMFALVVYMLLKSRGDGLRAFFRLLVALLIVLVCFFAVMNVPFLYDMVGYRIDSMVSGLLGGTGSDASTSTRMSLIDHGIEFFRMSPVFGNGGANFSALDAAIYRASSGYYAHNNFVEILADYGLIGFGFYYWMYALMVVTAAKRVKSLSLLQILVLALLVTLLVMEYGFVSYYDRFFQVFLAMAYCVLVVSPETSAVGITERQAWEAGRFKLGNAGQHERM